MHQIERDKERIECAILESLQDIDVRTMEGVLENRVAKAQPILLVLWSRVSNMISTALTITITKQGICPQW